MHGQYSLGCPTKYLTRLDFDPGVCKLAQDFLLKTEERPSSRRDVISDKKMVSQTGLDRSISTN
jgi:hypothetical protein